MNRNLSGMLLTAFAFCITISCSDRSATDPTGLSLNDSTAAEARIASATVTLAQSSLQVGQTTQATAVLLDRYNRPISLAVAWGSSDSSLATVSGSGLVTARSPGTVSITASRGGKTGSASLTVTPAIVSVATVTVNLAASSLNVGDTTHASATLRDSSNNVLTGRAVVWTSSNVSAATLSDSGRVTALAIGSTMISASTEGHIGTAPLAVTAPSPIPVASVTVSPTSANLGIGATVQLQVSAFDANNNPLTGRLVTSSSADPGIASINSLGLVTAVSADTTQITVTSEGKSAVATIIVSATPPPVTNPGTVTDLQAAVTGSTSITVSFTQVNDGTGQPAKYDVRYAVAPISWGSATATTNGTCTTPVAGTAIGSQISCTVLGLAPATNYNFQLVPFRGTLNLNAVFGSLSNIASGTTTASGPVPVASVSVSPLSSTLQIGATVQLQVTAYDANNNVLTGRVVTSSSANALIASVNSLGVVTAISAGTTQITVTSEGKSAIATITVSAAVSAPVATVTVSPASSSLIVGSTAQLSATTRDASNNILSGRVVTWSSANSGIASVSSNGLVTARDTGTTQISATSEGKVGSAVFTITAPPPPPPPGSYNEPAGMTLIDERPFNSLAEHAAPHVPAWDTDPTLSIVQDATAPLSPSNVIRATYPAGFTAGTGPGHAGVPHTAYQTVYIRFAAKLSLNWVGNGSSTSKYMYEWIQTPNKPAFYFAAHGVGSEELLPYVMLQDIVVFPNANGNWGPNLVPSARIIRGQWQVYEIILRGNSAGTADGSVDWYLDGVHVGSVGGIQWSPAATTFTIFEFHPIWGGANTVPAITQTQTMDWDNVYLSGKN